MDLYVSGHPLVEIGGEICVFENALYDRVAVGELQKGAEDFIHDL